MIYDHEREADSPRERPVADWGGDDLFTSMPRRFARHAEGRPRRFAAAAGTGIRRAGAADGRHAVDHHARVGAGHAAAPSSGGATVAMPEPLPLIVSGDEAAVALAPAAVATRRAPSGRSSGAGSELERRSGAVLSGTGTAGTDLAWSRESAIALADAPAPEAADLVEASVVPPTAGSTPGRRTVTITGRPGVAAAPVRRRPSPTVHDRIGGRPDRIAAWAFGLGITLILIAVGTADAAVL